MQHSTDGKRLTPPLFNPNFGVCRCTRSPMLGINERMGLELFGREITFEEFQPMWSRYLIVRTDRWTEERHAISQPSSALASCGNEIKNCTQYTEYSPLADFSRYTALNIHYY